MANEVTLNDVIEMEAYFQAGLDKARKLRAKLQGEEQKRMKRGFTPENIARVNARFEKNLICGRARLEANKKAGL